MRYVVKMDGPERRPGNGGGIGLQNTTGTEFMQYHAPNKRIGPGHRNGIFRHSKRANRTWG